MANSSYQPIFDHIIGKNVSIDTRTIKSGDVFFALGKGIDYIDEALSKGASYIVKENAHDALLAYGLYIKELSKAKIIGITGSVGKTTTKFWLAKVLGRKHKTLAGIRNYNTMYGVPVCLSMLEKDHEYGVFELGSNHAGEIKELTEYLKPDIAIITNINSAHVGNFGSLEKIAEEKISIIKGIKQGGHVLFPEDIQYHDEIIEIALENNINPIQFKDFPVSHLPTHFHSLCGCILSVIEDVLGFDPKEYIPFLNDLYPLPGRGEMARYSYNGKVFNLIDDTYNASIASMEAALEALASYMQQNKKLAILGEMKELGEFSIELHERLARKAKDLEIDKLIFIGSEEFDGIFKSNGFEVFRETDDETVRTILDFVENGDIVLVKGSRSLKLENITDVLQRII